MNRKLLSAVISSSIFLGVGVAGTIGASGSSALGTPNSTATARLIAAQKAAAHEAAVFAAQRVASQRLEAAVAAEALAAQRAEAARIAAATLQRNLLAVQYGPVGNGTNVYSLGAAGAPYTGPGA